MQVIRPPFSYINHPNSIRRNSLPIEAILESLEFPLFQCHHTYLTLLFQWVKSHIYKFTHINPRRCETSGSRARLGYKQTTWKLYKTRHANASCYLQITSHSHLICCDNWENMCDILDMAGVSRSPVALFVDMWVPRYRVVEHKLSHTCVNDASQLVSYLLGSFGEQHGVGRQYSRPQHTLLAHLAPPSAERTPPPDGLPPRGSPEIQPSTKHQVFSALMSIALSQPEFDGGYISNAKNNKMRTNTSCYRAMKCKGKHRFLRHKIPKMRRLNRKKSANNGKISFEGVHTFGGMSSLWLSWGETFRHKF